MKIELRSIDSIKPYPSNPRVNDDAVEAVAASLKEFGFRQPIVVDAEDVIIVGHTRYPLSLPAKQTSTGCSQAELTTPPSYPQCCCARARRAAAQHHG